MSIEHIPERFLPDKAIDIIDGTAETLAVTKADGGGAVVDARRAVESLQNRRMVLSADPTMEDGVIAALDAQIIEAVSARDAAIRAWKAPLANRWSSRPRISPKRWRA